MTAGEHPVVFGRIEIVRKTRPAHDPRCYSPRCCQFNVRRKALWAKAEEIRAGWSKSQRIRPMPGSVGCDRAARRWSKFIAQGSDVLDRYF